MTRALLVCLPGAILLGLSIDAPSVAWMAGFSVAPLLYYQLRGDARIAAGTCAAFIIVSFAMLLHPLAPTTPVGTALTVLAAGLLYGSVAYLVARLFSQLKWNPLAVAAVWFLVESLKSFLGLEWGTLGYTQWNDSVLLPLASSIGARGISLALWLLNAYLAMVATRVIDKQRMPGLAAWGAGLVASAALLITLPSVFVDEEPAGSSEQTLAVIAVPGHYSGKQKRAAVYDVATRETILEGYLSATRDALRSQGPAPLVIWPETAVPVIADRDYWLKQAFLQANLPAETTILLGAFGVESLTQDRHNSAYALSAAGAALGRYDKVRLTPFFEHQPLPWLWRWLPRGGRHPGANPFEFAPGAGSRLLEMAGAQIGVNICYEESFPAGFREQAAAGAEMLVVLSSYTPFEHTDVADHMAIFSRFRAAENGRWLLHCSNFGSTMLIDPEGRVTAHLPHLSTLQQPLRPSKAGADAAMSLRAEIPLRSERTLYVRGGHTTIMAGCLMVLGLTVVPRLAEGRLGRFRLTEKRR